MSFNWIRKSARMVFVGGLKLVRRVPPLRSVLDQHAFHEFIEGGVDYGDREWYSLERVFTFVRRQLYADPTWRYGPLRVEEVAREAYGAISPHMSLRDTIYCDLGCGAHHPFGTSAIMYLNGAGAAVALDLEPVDAGRSAEALYDLLCWCLADPDRWRWSDIDRAEFEERLKRFDIDALRGGDLSSGLSGTPLSHAATDIHSPSLKAGSIDIMSSRAALEHVMDFPTAARRLFELMAAGGVAFHHIDLVDHRFYVDPSRYHRWSFLAEDDDWTDGVVNRLRPSDFLSHFTSAGFEILISEPRLGMPPDGFRHALRGRFTRMSEEDIRATGLFCVIRKPV